MTFTGTTAVVDLGLGNIGSILNMLKKIGAPGEVVSSPAQLSSAARIVLPGVGAFDRGMERLEAGSWKSALCAEVMDRRKPILGICLGMQLFCRRSEEGRLSGLGWIDADVVRFESSSDCRIPHMGWNEVTPRQNATLFKKELGPLKYYFLHSYHLKCDDVRSVEAVCRYGVEFACAIRSANIYGVQFHPEKSHAFGMRLLKNFSELS